MDATDEALHRNPQVTARLRMIQHYEQVTRNVSKTCRFFWLSRNQPYVWLRRYRELGLAGLQTGPLGVG